MKLQIINSDSEHVNISCDLIVTDPPFQLPGEKIASILENQFSDHLILITTMRQLLSFSKASNWQLAFDFVLDQVVPKKAKSQRQPNYTHATCVYMTRKGAKSLFDRKLRQRSDTFDGNGYWPTILRAPRDRMKEFGYAKNTEALVDVVGCFNVQTIGDLFGGSGTIARVAFELGLDCIYVEKDRNLCEIVRREFEFMGIRIS